MRKFKEGDEVLVTDKERHKLNPRYYPAEGSYGKILSEEYGYITVQYGPNSGTAYDHVWSTDPHSVRKVTQKDRNRAVRYYARYVFAPALNNRDRYGSIFTNVEMAYVKPSENKLLAEQEIKQHMQAEGGVDYRVIYAKCQDFTTAYAAENILVINTKSATYRYDLDFCRNEYKKRVMGIKETQAKVDAALEVCRRG